MFKNHTFKSVILISIFSILQLAMFNNVCANQNSCNTPYAEHGIYDATILYMIDETIEGPLFLPMDADRNTFDYRQSAYNYFQTQFGITFDPLNPGIQVIVDDLGGTANVFPLKTGIGSTHQIYGIDAQKFPKWRHKMPMTDVAFFDDGFFVTLDTDFQLKGKFGGSSGVVLTAGTQLVFGEYRMFDGDGELLETFRYRSDIPVAGIPVTGNPETSGGALFLTIACDIESDLFGNGDVRSLAEIKFQPDGKTDLDFRYVMRFPARLSESDLDKPHCKSIKPLN